MSLEIAASDGRYAIVVSDGLEWNDSGIVREDSVKQIRLGQDIVVSGGGYSRELQELFLACQCSYVEAVKRKWVPLDEVLDEFIGHIRQKHFPGFYLTCLCGLLAARRDDGFLLVRQRANFDHQEQLVKPGDDPGFAYCTPTGRVEALCCCFMNQAVLEPMKRGACPAQIIANLRALYHAAASIESPPKLNENLRIDILGDVTTGLPCAPDAALESALTDFVSKVRALDARLGGGFQFSTAGREVAEVSGGTAEGTRANNAVTNNGELSSDPAQTLTLAEAVYGTVTISTDGGNVEIYAKCNVVNSSGATEVIQAALRKDSLTGAVLDSSTVTVSATINKSTLFLSAIDPTPSASQSYVLTLFCGSTPSTVSNIRIIAANRKK